MPSNRVRILGLQSYHVGFCHRYKRAFQTERTNTGWTTNACLGLHRQTQLQNQQPFYMLLDNDTVSLRGRLDPGLFLSQTLIAEGSKSNDEYRRLQPLFEGWRYGLYGKLSDDLRTMQDSAGYNFNTMTVFEMIKQSLVSEMRQALEINDSRQGAVPYLFVDAAETIGHDSITKPLFSELSDRIKNSYYGRLLKGRLKLAIGSEAPDFVSETPNGDSVSLSEVTSRNKLTLLDFWGSNCGPCRLEFRKNVVGLYAEYKPKGFEVLAVSYDENGDKWKQAIASERLSWINVSSLKGTEDPEVDNSANIDPALRTYKISHTPQNVLIGPDGKIIAWDVYGPELHWYLDLYLSGAKNS